MKKSEIALALFSFDRLLRRAEVSVSLDGLADKSLVLNRKAEDCGHLLIGAFRNFINGLDEFGDGETAVLRTLGICLDEVHDYGTQTCVLNLLCSRLSLRRGLAVKSREHRTELCLNLGGNIIVLEDEVDCLAVGHSFSSHSIYLLSRY